MNRFVVVFVLLSLISGKLFCEQLNPDSLKSLINQQENDTLKILTLKKISNYYKASSNDSALLYAEKMLALAKQKQILYYVSDAWDVKANIFEHMGKLDDCVNSIDSAKYYAQLIDDPLGVIYFATNKGSVCMKMGSYFEALQSFEESQKIAEQINRPDRVAAALNNIGAVYHYLGDDETSLDYFIQSYEVRLENNLTKNLAYSLNNIGAVYSKYGNYDEALTYHKKALETARQQSDDYNYLIALINIGLDYSFLKNFDSSLRYYKRALKEAEKQGDKTSQAHVMERMSIIYVMENDFDYAKILLKQALEISEASGNKYDIAAFSNSLGIIFLKEKNFGDALPLFKRALKVARQINANKVEADVYKSFTEYYYARDNSKEAFRFQKLLDQKRDSLYKAETDLKIANLKNRFELNQKLKELELKEVELRSEKKISNERLVIIYIIGFAGFVLLLMLVFILFLYRKIRNQNQTIRQSEEKVKELLEKEKEIGKLKTQLISTVSHEFRTPMAIISSNAQMLYDMNDSMDDVMRKETLGYINGGVENMISMMRNFEILDKNTILEFNPKPIDVGNTCLKLANGLQSLPKYKGRIEFINNLNPGKLIMDAGLITHIVRNLLINALKFSDNKTVNVILEKSVDNLISICVADRGIGMSSYDAEKIFENFHRGTNATNIKGTGIGMSVVKRCVDLHNGKIKVESKLNKGTTIKVTLPYK